MQGRFRFSVATVVSTVLLMSWGAFVTSIDAGLAVPDWPTSFDSYDPFNPWPNWWTMTPVLAEHGHRLLGALTGLLTLILAIWTLLREPRQWMRRLSVIALVLVIVQGVLGGLRVVWVSLDLAVVHACVAQIFFSLIVCMALFTSNAWLSRKEPAVGDQGDRGLRRLAMATTGAIYIQIILGALLRHPGTGIDLAFASIHIFWAFVVVGLVVGVARRVQTGFLDRPGIRRSRNLLLGVLLIQFLLGLTAFFVLLDESGMVQPSNLQVVVNSAHMVVGALVLASSVVLSAWTFRRSAEVIETAPNPALTQIA